MLKNSHLLVGVDTEALCVAALLNADTVVPKYFVSNVSELLLAIEEKFTINMWLFLVPISVIVLIVKRTPPLIALLFGTLMGALFALLFQSQILLEITGSDVLNASVAYQAIMNAITVSTKIATSNILLNDLFVSGGMEGMLGTIWLIICAMVFGGIMDAVNLTASDQYLSIVIPGKMFKKAYEERKLAPENLSRTLEDSGTVTSVLIPWNTCGAYQSGVLNVGVGEYFIFAIFNWISPFMTLLYAALDIKILKKS